MKLSTKSRYGLRILTDIAVSMANNNGASKGRDIAQRQNLTEAYLEQIMIPLKSSNLIRTQRGCRGGYILNAEPADITVLDVIESFEGKISFVDCLDTDECTQFARCPTQDVWRELSRAFRAKAASITLQDIVDTYNEQNKNFDFII
jgi:Rrf2 family protein